MSRAEREGWRDESSLASCSNRASRVFVSLSFGGVKKRCGDRREKGLTHKKGTKSLFAASSSYFTHKKPTLVLHQPLCKCSSSCGLFPYSVCKQCCCTAINQKCPPSCAPSVCAFVCVTGSRYAKGTLEKRQTAKVTECLLHMQRLLRPLP